MSLTSWTGKASQTPEPKAWMIRAAIKPPYEVAWDAPISPAQ